MRSDWDIAPLGELISFMSKGIAPYYAENESQNTIRVLNQKCNRNFAISYEDSRLNDITKKAVSAERYLQVGDILINSTGTGTAGRVAQVDEVPVPTTVDGHMIILRANKKIDAAYLGYALKLKQPLIESLAEGSTGQTELNRNRLSAEVMVTYPSCIGVQKEIVRTLRALDDKIANNIKINLRFEKMAQAIFKSWFVDFEPWGGVMPKDWRTGVLSDICAYNSERVSVSALTFNTYISTENMLTDKGGFVKATSLPTIPQTTAFAIGDILVSNIRPYFKKIVYCGFTGGCSTDVLCFRPNKENLSLFVYNTLYRDNFFDYMVAGSKGTKMPRGDKQQIMNYQVVIPSDSVLDDFASHVAPMTQKRLLLTEESTRLAELRDTLLPRLMSGEIPVTNGELNNN